ncbi:MAG TPA: histidine phosphatase family protein [Nitrospira sp.]|jgi:broad specificity phosphatase PhoE|nr:histidine phosphatase family protein [Nitrospira sp.]
MPILLFIRHGETDWNRSGRVMGDQPIPLNHTGERQALACAEVLSRTPIAGLFTSPVLRAVQTADILGRPHGGLVQHLPDLREIGVGDWINRYWKEFANDPAKRHWYTQPDLVRPSGGETLQEVQHRAVTAVEQVIGDTQDKPYVFVSHADVIRAIVAHYMRLDLGVIRHATIDHVSVSGLDLTGQASRLLFLNHRPGLHRFF